MPHRPATPPTAAIRPRVCRLLVGVLLATLLVPGGGAGATETGCSSNTAVSHEQAAHSCRLEVVGSLDLTPHGTGQIAVHEDLVAVVRRDEGVVTLVDIGDPSAPAALGSYDGGTGVGALDHPLDGDVAFSDDGRVLLYARQTNDYSNEGLHVLDVADPANPVRTDLALQGGMLRVAYQRIGERELVVTLDATHGLTIFQLLRSPLGATVVPLHVDPLPQLKVGGPASAGIEIVADDPVVGGPALYVTDGTTGLRVLDLTDPTSPRLHAAWDGQGLAAIVVSHADGKAIVHAAAEYWFDRTALPELVRLTVDGDGIVTESARWNLGGYDGSIVWKLGGMDLVDGELVVAHGHGGLLSIDPADGAILRATTDLGAPGGPRPDLGFAAWYAMDVVGSGEHLLATDAVTGHLQILRRG